MGVLNVKRCKKNAYKILCKIDAKYDDLDVLHYAKKKWCT